jgi:hypothetical protein
MADVAASVASAFDQAAARAFLDRTYHGYWRDTIAALSQQQWWEPIGASFGAYGDLCTTDLALHVLDELTHHAAEIGLLRDFTGNGTAGPETGLGAEPAGDLGPCFATSLRVRPY